ncbi:NUDIX hydrolase [Thalassotalea aquiviva]|uniref:NUDIX hydrolase n=1 Tax=Thalassotalea aquiviva TaxID=3242415 RepID=UPI00352A91E5
MRLIRSTVHPDINLETGRQFTRLATRAIVLKGDEILLLYTQRYHDYSLPGGGIDEGEDKIQGLLRELKEETGAQNIKILSEFGVYEEYRPWYKDDYDIMHMLSYCYFCQIDEQLAIPQLEAYEIANGMEPVWINIEQAIAHNEQTIASSDKKGLSIERETFLLKRIAEQIYQPA